MAHPEFTINNPAWGTVEWEAGEGGWHVEIRANPGYYIKSWRYVERLTGWGSAAGMDSVNTYGWINGLTTETQEGFWANEGTRPPGDFGWEVTVEAAWIEFAPTGESDLYTITTSPSPPAAGTTSGDGQFAAGVSCTVVATAMQGWRFVRWTENGTEVSTNANYTFRVASSRGLVAVFEQNGSDEYEITTAPSPAEGGTTSGDGTYAAGASCTVVATAADGWEFVRWSEEGKEVSTAERYSFTATADRDLVAEFVREFTITFNRLGVSLGKAEYSPPVGGTERVKIKYGDPWPSIEVPTAEGYTFGGYYTGGPGDISGQWDPYATKWYNADGSPVNATFTGTEDMTLDALWSPNRYDLTIDPNGGTYAPKSSHQSNVPVIYRGGLTFGGMYLDREYAAKREGYEFLGYYTQPQGGVLVYRPDPGNPIEEEEPDSGAIFFLPAVVGVEGAYWTLANISGLPARYAYVHPGPLVVYARWKRIPTHLILRNNAGGIMRSASSGAILRDY